MPVANKRSRDAKKRQVEGHKQGRTEFAKWNAMPPSPNTSDYCPSTSDNSHQESESDDGNDSREIDEAKTSVEAIQCLYSDFLPPHLQLSPETRAKRQRINKRPAVYTKTSRTTIWRKRVALKEAAKGCAMLDAFIQRKVCTQTFERSPKRSMTPSIEETAKPLTT